MKRKEFISSFKYFVDKLFEIKDTVPKHSSDIYDRPRTTEADTYFDYINQLSQLSTQLGDLFSLIDKGTNNSPFLMKHHYINGCVFIDPDFHYTAYSPTIDLKDSRAMFYTNFFTGFEYKFKKSYINERNQKTFVLVPFTKTDIVKLLPSILKYVQQKYPKLLSNQDIKSLIRYTQSRYYFLYYFKQVVKHAPYAPILLSYSNYLLKAVNTLGDTFKTQGVKFFNYCHIYFGYEFDKAHVERKHNYSDVTDLNSNNSDDCSLNILEGHSQVNVFKAYYVKRLYHDGNHNTHFYARLATKNDIKQFFKQMLEYAKAKKVISSADYSSASILLNNN